MSATIIDGIKTALSYLPLDIALHLSLFLLVCYSCLKTRREATSSILWIFTAWAFPVLGPLLYLMFGINHVPRKALRKHTTDRRFQTERQAREDAERPMAAWSATRQSLAGEPADEDARYLNRALNSILPEDPLMSSNLVTPLVDGDQAYPAMLEAISNARNHVHLQTFIVGNDKTGRKFLDLLAAKARDGVKVRFLYDRFGSTAAAMGGLFNDYRRVPNMAISGWTQSNLLKRQFQFNLRNHRKIAVIDGKTGFIGGVNLRDDNTSGESGTAIRDYHFMVRGPVVHEMQYAFLRDWYFMTDENPNVLLSKNHFPKQESCGPAMARLANSGPTSEEMEVIAKVFFECISWARSELLVVTPYFAPSADILQALKSAARRGVNIRLLMPLDNNHIYTELAGMALYEELMDNGVRIFRRRPPFIHAKALVADGQVALIGSANFDLRSLRLNYESNMAVFDDDFALRLRAIILNDFAAGEEINPVQWRRRPLRRKMLENASYLLTPIL